MIGGGDFELIHPRCIEERRDDYEEGLEALRAGEPEEAVEMLRYALNGCPDNLWIHAALGRIALKETKDPTLARGHFGYALELVLRILPRDFTGRLPRNRPANAPLYDALEGLIASVDTLKLPAESRDLRGLLARLSGEPIRPANP